MCGGGIRLRLNVSRERFILIPRLDQWINKAFLMYSTLPSQDDTAEHG